MGRTIYKSLPKMSLARNRKDSPALLREKIEVADSLKSFASGKTYFIQTFGCQANVRDEEILSGYLEAAGFTKAKDNKDADLVIINTCAVRENAEEKVYGEIGTYKAKHLKDKSFILAVCGCMMQQEGKAERIKTFYPYVNIIFGTHNISSILDLLTEHIERKKDLVDIISFQGDIHEDLPSSRLLGHKAYVNITYGCDKFCTYCIVPYTRGRERSRKKEDILKECKSLVEQGYKEITLLGQNVNSYGKDFHDGTSFAQILKEVAELGIPRLRFMTSHPWDFIDEMIDVIASHKNIVKCIHLPVQSGSDEILRRMGRRYTREEYLNLVSKIRKRMPECAITTDIIVGFPGENEEQFEETISLCEEVKYDAAFTFIYSPRNGTPAAAMVDNVDHQTKQRHFDKLLKAVEQGVSYHSSQMIEKTYDVLVDGPSKKGDGMISGYTESGKLINFKGPAYLEGCIVPVKVMEDHVFAMIGQLEIDPIIALANDLSSNIANSDICRRFKEAKEALETDKSVALLREKMENTQKEMVLYAADKKQKEYQSAKEEYQRLEKDYFNHPIVMNYQSVYDEMEALLNEVQESLK